MTTLAIFDLDGTLTHRDTLVPWWGRLFWHPRLKPERSTLGFRLKALGLTAVALVRYLVHRDRGHLKAALLQAVLHPYALTDVHDLARAYVNDLTDATFNPAVRARLQEHQRLGHTTLLLSASVDAYVPLIAQRLGFDDCVCSQLRWVNGTLAPTLQGENVRGLTKARVVERLQKRHPGAIVYAYGNAGSDLPHLMLVDRPYLVNASTADRRRAQRLGIPTQLDAPLAAS